MLFSGGDILDVDLVFEELGCGLVQAEVVAVGVGARLGQHDRRAEHET